MKRLFASLLTCALFASTFTAKAIDVGNTAPVFTLPQLQTKQATTLAAFAGKVIYVDFWASWCAPCRTSFPLLNALHKKLQAKGFEVIAINLDEDEASARQFIKEVPVDFTVLYDGKGEWADQYVIESMPTSFIIDKKGRVQKVHHGFTSTDITDIEHTLLSLLAQ
ncbi:MAG: TlpA family protein disulfide reductase [Methylovulum sp.]